MFTPSARLSTFANDTPDSETSREETKVRSQIWRQQTITCRQKQALEQSHIPHSEHIRTSLQQVWASLSLPRIGPRVSFATLSYSPPLYRFSPLRRPNTDRHVYTKLSITFLFCDIVAWLDGTAMPFFDKPCNRRGEMRVPLHFVVAGRHEMSRASSNGLSFSASKRNKDNMSYGHRNGHGCLHELRELCKNV